MKNARKELLEEIARYAYMDMHTALSSGMESNYYVDCRRIILNPSPFICIGKLFYNKIKNLKDVTSIGGMSFGADPIAVATMIEAFNNNKFIKTFSIRKNIKKHGTKNKIEGDLSKEEKIVVVDDVLTTGNSIINSIIELRKRYNSDIQKVIVLVDRQEGGLEEVKKHISNVESIFTVDDIRKVRDELE